jgi:iron complex transport system permease protein
MVSRLMAYRARPSTGVVLVGLTLLVLLGVVLFMTVGAKGSWGFILPFRGTKVATMAVVAVAIGVSTVLFQTLAANRVLTPSIMGFDTLYALIQTVMVASLGASAVAGMSVYGRFLLEAGVMTGFSVLLYRWLFSGSLRGLHLLMLVGIVCGLVFQSLTSFLKRVIDPTTFLTVQDRLFASFNRPDSLLLAVSAAVVGLVVLGGWRFLPALDVLALGRERAISLGVAYRPLVMGGLMAVALLVSVSTALVGPVLFLGLLVAHVASVLIPSSRHCVIMPAASLVGLCFLLYGQLVLEHLFGFDTALGIIIEFTGGLLFLWILLKGWVR